MKTEAETAHIYQFGEFKIDTAEETLHRNGVKLNINRRTFQVLRLLVERSGEIVSKQDFFDTVWADTFVEDNSLTVAMTALRKVLGDTAKAPTFIENLPRKGYRFIGKVNIVDETADVRQTEHTPARPIAISESVFRNRKVLVGTFAACLLFLLVVLGFSYFGFSESSANSGQIESIAVLPFQNQNSDTEYLSDGLTESVINNLSGLPNLRVISRNSVFLYKGKEIDVQTVGRELNVRAVLTGRLVQEGDNLIVNAELTDLRDNKQIWGSQYTRKTSDAFSLQQKISRDISETLRSKLPGKENRELTERQTDSPDAFLLYLKGRYHWNKRTDEGFEKAIEFFNQALEKDPTYALAYFGLANCYSSVSFKYVVTNEERVAMVKAAANRALEINPKLGEAYATLAINSHFHEWDWVAAEKQYKLALELSPNYATAHHWYAEFLATEGRFDESFAEYHRALELDPLSLAISTDLGLNYYYARQYDKAIEHLTKLKEANPNYARTSVFLAAVYEEKELLHQAIEEHEKVGSINSANPEKLAADMSARKKAFESLGVMGYWRKTLEAIREDENPNGWSLVKCYIRLGEVDKAFELLEKTYTSGRSPVLVWLKVSPEFDNLRSDPRFADLMRHVGIPQ